MRKSLAIICILLIPFGFTLVAQQKANYGVEGWATYTPGGRGGRIVRVTNLNATGVGSFAQAIDETGPRIIVFEVGGVINLNGSKITVRNPYVTIAGQTAPEEGVTFINGGFNINTHDVILQHIRIRTGAAWHAVGAWEPDGLSTIGAYNVIIDHCSFSWAVDENCSASGDRFNGLTPDDWRNNTSHDITISNNIIAEGLSVATHTKGEHSKGTLIHDNTSNIAVLNNLYASNKDRNPLFKGGSRAVAVNNYIYNPGSAAMAFGLVDAEWLGYAYETGRLSVVGNFMHYGPSTSASLVFFKMGNGPCELYMEDNTSHKLAGVYQNEFSGDLSKKVSAKPIWHDNIHVIPAVDVQQNIIKNAGARPWGRDTTDIRIINEMQNGTGKIINFETEVGGFPNYAASSKPFLEANWNLDYMLPLNPDVSFLSPDSGSQFFKDDVIAVEASINSNNDSIKSLDLLVNGISVGKLFTPPYTWDLSLSEAGSYDLLLVADVDSMMKTATKTRSISIIDTTASGVKIAKAKGLSFSVSPNPFSTYTSIKYNVTKPTFVKLELYNALGARVETLVSAHQTSGEYTITWQPKGLASGLYFCYLTTEDGVASKKVICK